MNYKDFFHLLKSVAEKRLLKLLQTEEVNDITFDSLSIPNIMYLGTLSTRNVSTHCNKSHPGSRTYVRYSNINYI